MSADRELYGIVREIELVEEDIRDRNTAKSDIYKEAAAKGYDKKTIRKVVAARRQDPLEREEQDNQFDLYMQAIERAEKGLPHARVENIEQFPSQSRPVNPAQEPTDYAAQSGDKSAATNLAGSAARGQAALSGECPEAPPMDGARKGPSGTAATNSPETETMSLGDGDGGLSPSNGAATSGMGVTAGETATDEVSADLGRQTIAPSAKIAPVSNPALVGTNSQSARSSSRADPTGAASPSPVVAPVDHFEPPAFLARQKTMADFRPNCREPDACRSSKLEHCYTCKKALEAAEQEFAA